MASRWYTCIQADWQKTKKKKGVADSIQDSINKIAISCGNGDSLGIGIMDLEGKPVVISVPKTVKKLNFLHLATNDDKCHDTSADVGFRPLAHRVFIAPHSTQSWLFSFRIKFSDNTSSLRDDTQFIGITTYLRCARSYYW